jgi:extracellular elastinolytic metalloproteinase
MHRLRLFALATVTFATVALAASPASFGQAQILDVHEGLGDFDARGGSVAPTAAQQAAVDAMGAEVRWNQFGTPKTLVRHGGYLATGLAAPSAASAARAWLEANKSLFRLASAADLRLDNASRLVGTDGYAVLFRQEFGGLAAVEDGLVVVGVEGSSASGWKIAYVSSSLTGDTSPTGAAALSAREAWAAAAANAGRAVPLVTIGAEKAVGGWTVFGVSGFGQPQRARLRALPTPSGGVVPVWETLFVDGEVAPSAYKHYVDARNGTVLFRQNIVENAHVTASPFTGTLTTDGQCGPDHGPYNAPANTQSIDVVASFDNPANDIVLRLKRGGVVVQAADTLFSPEAIHYEPSTGVPPGDYYVQACEYADGEPPLAVGNTYRGTITINHTAGANPFPYPPKWKVFPANPPLNVLPADPWNNPSTDTREIWCWDSNVEGTPIAGCQREVGNLASRAPWDHIIATDTPSRTTAGNNAKSQEAWESPLTPDPTPYSPVSANREYVYPWANQWFTSDCNYAQIVSTRNDIDAATTNLFVMHNRMHDWAYWLGFTEENWNAQDHNFGLTPPGRQNDAVLGNAQAGALTGPPPVSLGRDNANMIPLPDGVHPITNMYLWQPIAAAFYAPCVDGDYDMAVIGHEYGHLIENRMIGKGGTRTGHHAGAMGESNGDLNGMEILNEYGFVPTSDESRYAVGAYATGEKQRGIRNYNMSWPQSGAFPTPSTYPQVNPLNFSNMGYDITGPQVHADGEIWSATNFDIRQALVEKYNASFPASDAALQLQCAEGRVSADRCPGNRRWIQIVYDAYLLMPVGPSMLDARDAYLAADQMRFGGANRDEIWLAFARRGFGQNAVSSNTIADTDTDPKPDFASPRHSNATVTFQAVAKDEANAAITNARVYVGHYEARTSPVADTNPATTSTTPTGSVNNLDNVATFAPGTYEFVAHAPGYGHVRFRRALTPGLAETVTISMATNWASSAKGGAAAGDGTNHGRLIDDTEATQWERTGAAAPGSQVTVDLGGGLRVVSRVQVSALLAPPQSRFTAVRSFTISTCTAAGLTTCLLPTDFTTVYTSPADAFPADAPRPVAPHLILRDFDIPDTPATHVRFTVTHNQCTAPATDFQGDQDAGDPLNNSDCDSGSARDDEVRAAELQAFSTTSEAIGSGDVTPPPSPQPEPPPGPQPPGPQPPGPQPPGPQPPGPQPPGPQPPGPQPPGPQPPGPQGPFTPPVVPGACTIRGTEARDILRGTAGDDIICALGGNDLIYGLAGNDVIKSGTGNDRAFGGSGRDRIYGGLGNDYIAAGAGDDRVRANEGNDRVIGGGGRDIVYALAGHDVVYGSAGNDLLIGGRGRDRLFGQAGRDELTGGNGYVFVNGVRRARDERERDVLVGGAGRDRCSPNIGDRVSGC